MAFNSIPDDNPTEIEDNRKAKNALILNDISNTRMNNAIRIVSSMIEIIL
jgi:hypothetical protein